MAEPSSSDIANIKRPYEEGLKAYLGSQAAPRSFLEHPATRFIPTIGPILGIFGRMNQEKRLREAASNATLFDTLVSKGEFNEETMQHPSLQGIPLPILQSGLIESQQVRNTIGYQARKDFANFSQNDLPQAQESFLPNLEIPEGTPGYGSQAETVKTMQSPENRRTALQQYFRQFPEFAAALGLPEVGRIALQAQAQEAALPLVAQVTGQPFRGRGVGGQVRQSGQTPIQPPVFQGYTPEVTQSLTQTYQDFAQKKMTPEKLAAQLTAIPGLDPAQVPSLVEGFQIQAQNQQIDPTQGIEPLGSFNPRQVGTPNKTKVSLTPSGLSADVETISTQDRAAAYVLHHTLQNPQNYITAFRDITSKGITLTKDQADQIQQKAALPMFRSFVQEGIKKGEGNPRTSEGIYQISRRAIEQTDDALGNPMSKETRDSLQDPAVVAGMTAGIQERARLGEQAGQPGEALRQRETAQKIDTQRQQGELRESVPLSQIEGGDQIAARYQVPAGTSLKDIAKQLKLPFDQNLAKTATAATSLYRSIDYLEKLFLKTGPSESAVIASIKSLYHQILPGALKVDIRTYEQALEASIEIMGEIVNVSGQKYTNEDVKRYRGYFPTDRLDLGDALKRFRHAKQQVLLPYFEELDYRREGKYPGEDLYEKERGRPASGSGSKETIEETIKRHKDKGGNK